jgi:phage-related protein
MMGKKSLPLAKMVFWIGILGVLITAISYYAGMEHIQAFANFAGNFSREWSAFGNGNSTVAHKAQPVSVSPGLGTIGAGCAYIGAVITSFWSEGV